MMNSGRVIPKDQSKEIIKGPAGRGRYDRQFNSRLTSLD
jgi:hypothetical protein